MIGWRAQLAGVVILPIGRDLGKATRRRGDTGDRYRLKFGVETWTLSEHEYAVWNAVGRCDGPSTPKAVLRAYKENGLPKARQTLAELGRRGPLVGVPPETPDAMAIARAVRLLPRLPYADLSSLPGRSVPMAVGDHSTRELDMLTWEVLKYAHPELSLAGAVERSADEAMRAFGPGRNESQPGFVLGHVLRQAAKLVGDRTACFVASVGGAR